MVVRSLHNMVTDSLKGDEESEKTMVDRSLFNRLTKL